MNHCISLRSCNGSNERNTKGRTAAKSSDRLVNELHVLCCNVLIWLNKQLRLFFSSGDYIETGVSNQEDIKIKLNETYVISRVFLYPRSIADHQNGKFTFN